MLKVKDLIVEINWKKILDKISFQLENNQTLALLGHNWSGKTTLLKAIMGLVPAKGEIIFEEENIVDKEIFQRARMGIGYIMQEVPEYTWIKVYDYVKNILDLEKKFDEEKIAYYFDLLGLNWETYKDRNFDTHLSWWEKKKIEIITTFLLDRKLYLLDEIEASLDATSRQILAQIIKDLQNDWKSFILVSHNEEIISLANEGILLCDGKLQAQWDVKTLLNLYLNRCEMCNWKNFSECEQNN